MSEPMTWADLADAMHRDDVVVRNMAHFLQMLDQAGLDDVERQTAFRDYRANWGAQVRGWSLNGFWRQRRSGVKGRGRSYADASTANDEAAT